MINSVTTYQVFFQITSTFLKSAQAQHKGSNHFTLNVPSINTKIFGSNSIKIKAIKDWKKTA